MIDAVPQAALAVALVAGMLRLLLEVHVRLHVRRRPRPGRRIEWDRPEQG